MSSPSPWPSEQKSHIRFSPKPFSAHTLRPKPAGVRHTIAKATNTHQSRLLLNLGHVCVCVCQTPRRRKDTLDYKRLCFGFPFFRPPTTQKKPIPPAIARLWAQAGVLPSRPRSSLRGAPWAPGTWGSRAPAADSAPTPGAAGSPCRRPTCLRPEIRESGESQGRFKGAVGTPRLRG